MATRVGAIRNAWKETSSGERIAWKYLATIWPARNKLARVKTVTPFQLFFRHNMDRLIIGTGISTAIPFWAVETFPLAIDLYCDTDPLYAMDARSYTASFSHYIIVQMSRSFSKGSRTFFNNWKQVHVEAFTSPGPVLTDSVLATLGRLQYEEHVAARVRYVDDLVISSPWIQTQTIVVPP